MERNDIRGRRFRGRGRSRISLRSMRATGNSGTSSAAGQDARAHFPANREIIRQFRRFPAHLGCFGASDADSRSNPNALQAIPCSIATSEDFCPNRDLKPRIRESPGLPPRRPPPNADPPLRLHNHVRILRQDCAVRRGHSAHPRRSRLLLGSI
jgi:hypothetical protein